MQALCCHPLAKGPSAGGGVFFFFLAPFPCESLTRTVLLVSLQAAGAPYGWERWRGGVLRRAPG